jgi:hypothetical protein
MVAAAGTPPGASTGQGTRKEVDPMGLIGLLVVLILIILLLRLI